MWIYEYNNWPNFTWEPDIVNPKLMGVRHKQDLLLSKIHSLSSTNIQEINLINLTKNIVKSSAIEGEKLNTEEVRSSIARQLGINMAGLKPSSRNVLSVVNMMLDATENYALKLTKKRLLTWQAALFPGGISGLKFVMVGSWRILATEPMLVVSGSIGREKVHFKAPKADKLEAEMTSFLNWFNDKQQVDPVLKAAIAHLWFVTIHPFEDGNGRIARAITDMALARADKTKNRFYSMSSQIELERRDYYNTLEKQQKSNLDITTWLAWFLDCLDRAISNAETSVNNVIFKTKLWEIINENPVNERQKTIINKMLLDDFKGYMSTKKYTKLAKCSDDTALRDINILKKRKILIQNPGGGRSTSYRIIDKESLEAMLLLNRK